MWSQAIDLGSRRTVSQDIEELAVARLQLAKGPPSQHDYVPMLRSDFVFHVLDPRCRVAYQYLARHTSLSDGFERLTHGVHVEEV